MWCDDYGTCVGAGSGEGAGAGPRDGAGSLVQRPSSFCCNRYWGSSFRSAVGLGDLDLVTPSLVSSSKYWHLVMVWNDVKSLAYLGTFHSMKAMNAYWNTDVSSLDLLSCWSKLDWNAICYFWNLDLVNPSYYSSSRHGLGLIHQGCGACWSADLPAQPRPMGQHNHY